MADSEPDYRFRFERVRDALKAASGEEVTENSFEDWYDVVEDGSEWGFLITSEQLATTIDELLEAGRPRDPRHGAWHSAALKSLASHDRCEEILADLLAERDDAVAGIVEARSFAFTDMFEGEYGDLYVDVEMVLNRLRPRLRGRGPFRTYDALEDAGWCEECGEQWAHDDNCAIEVQSQALARRRESLIATHLFCPDLGKAVVEHSSRCVDRAERIAEDVLGMAHVQYGEEVFHPQSVLPQMKVESLNVQDDGSPAALMLAVWPTYYDPPYCRGETHADPHRACRYLIS